jgi:hypothetical protein
MPSPFPLPTQEGEGVRSNPAVAPAVPPSPERRVEGEGTGVRLPFRTIIALGLTPPQ